MHNMSHAGGGPQALDREPLAGSERQPARLKHARGCWGWELGIFRDAAIAPLAALMLHACVTVKPAQWSIHAENPANDDHCVEYLDAVYRPTSQEGACFKRKRPCDEKRYVLLSAIEGKYYRTAKQDSSKCDTVSFMEGTYVIQRRLPKATMIQVYSNGVLTEVVESSKEAVVRNDMRNIYRPINPYFISTLSRQGVKVDEYILAPNEYGGLMYLAVRPE